MNLILVLEFHVIIFMTEVLESFGHREMNTNGKNDTIRTFRYIANIWPQGKRKTYFGGALISYRWVLTSALCIDDGPDWLIILSSTHKNKDVSEKSTISMKSEVGLKHHASRNHSDYHIGLLKLVTGLKLDEVINRVILPKKRSLSDPLVNVEIEVMGWGKAGSPLEDHLMYETHITRPKKKCTLGFHPRDTIFCSDPLGNKQTLLAADYGLPAVQRNNDSQKKEPILESVILEGIVVAIEMDYDRYSFKYVRIVHYLEWIFDVTDLPIRP